MQTLREVIDEAKDKKVAIGHFNISTIDGLWAIFRAANELDLPVIIGVSEGERDFLGVHVVAAAVKAIRNEYKYPIFLTSNIAPYRNLPWNEELISHDEVGIFEDENNPSSASRGHSKNNPSE